MSKAPAPERICVAKIATAHGVRGLVKLHVFVENLQLLNNKLYTGPETDQTLTLTLKNATSRHWLAEIKEIGDRTEAEKWRGTELYLPKSALPELEDGEMYVTDMVGLPVEDENGGAIGEVKMIQNWGAGDLLEIAPAEGGDTFYLPYTDETVLDASPEKVVVRIPEGLRE
jgi:16S rRNA processing protein RimM